MKTILSTTGAGSYASSAMTFRKVVLIAMMAGFPMAITAQYYDSGPATPPQHLFSFHGFGEAEKLRQPRAVFIDKEHGELYVLVSNGKIHVYTEDGVFLYRFGANEGILNPQDIAVTRSGKTYISQGRLGNILVCDYRGVIDHLHSLSGVTSTIYPWQLAVDGEDNLYVADQNEKSIIVFDNEEKLLRRIPNLNGMFSAISNIAVDSTGNLYVVNGLTSGIHVFNRRGIHIRSFGRRGSGTGKLSAPAAVGIDSDSRIYILDANRQMILVYSEYGEFSYEFGGLGREELRFFYPSDIAIGNEGRLYVSDSMNDRIQVLLLHGN